MSMDPSMIQQLLMQRLQQPGSAGGGMGGPQMQGGITPQNMAAQLAQKAMLVRALQGAQQRQQQGVANNMLPGTNQMMQNQNPQMMQNLQNSSNAAMAQDPAMQALQQPLQIPG